MIHGLFTTRRHRQPARLRARRRVGRIRSEANRGASDRRTNRDLLDRISRRYEDDDAADIAAVDNLPDLDTETYVKVTLDARDEVAKSPTGQVGEVTNVPDTRRVVIVTGAGGTGCGRAIARRFAAGGAAVVVCDIDEAGGRETVRGIEASGGRAKFVRADVRKESEVRDLVSFAEIALGGLHVLVNNASAPKGGDRLEEWADTLETDLLGAIHATRWAIEAMRRGGGGAIVNIASISALWHGRKTPGGLPGYDVAKAGMIRMTTRLASLAKTDGIRVNCLAPGWIATDGPRQYWESLTPSERAARGVPSRLLTTDEIAEMVVRLAEDRSLAGRVVVWGSEDSPSLIPWGDRGYRGLSEF